MPGISDFPDGDISYQRDNPTLCEVIFKNPTLFYDQFWYYGEAFTNRRAEPLSGIPDFDQWSFPYLFPKQDCQRASAASLCWLYVQNPDAEIWNRFLWCDDLDSRGDRIYIGGKSRTGKLEIHRYLTINSNFGLPKW
jgi:hypothetical protein